MEKTFWDPYSEFEKTVLPNGLTVYAAHWPGRAWQKMGFLIHSGAKHDPVGFEGTAHFVEHVVSENASISNDEISSFFGDLGGNAMLGTTNYEGTWYSMRLPTDKQALLKGLDIFGDMLLSATLKNSVERERDVILNEFKRKFPVEFRLQYELNVKQALFAGHWFERFVTPLGRPETINKITQAVLQEYYDTHYNPANMSIVAVGGLSLDEVVDLLNKSPFAVMCNGTRMEIEKPFTKFSDIVNPRTIVDISVSIKSITTGVYASKARFPGNISNAALDVSSALLRKVLFREIRLKKGLTYDTSVNWNNFSGVYLFDIEVAGGSLKELEIIESITNDCIQSLSSETLLFEQIKKQKILNQKMGDITGEDLCYGALFDLRLYQKILSVQDFCSRIEKVTLDDVEEVMVHLRPENRYSTLLHP